MTCDVWPADQQRQFRRQERRQDAAITNNLRVCGRLEYQVGVELLSRSVHGVELTAAVGYTSGTDRVGLRGHEYRRRRLDPEESIEQIDLFLERIRSSLSRQPNAFASGVGGCSRTHP